MSLFSLVAAALAAERFHGNDINVSVKAKVKTDTATSWIDVRDDRPFAGPIHCQRCAIVTRSAR
jgi:hypothetical protein